MAASPVGPGLGKGRVGQEEIEVTGREPSGLGQLPVQHAQAPACLQDQIGMAQVSVLEDQGQGQPGQGRQQLPGPVQQGPLLGGLGEDRLQEGQGPLHQPGEPIVLPALLLLGDRTPVQLRDPIRHQLAVAGPFPAHALWAEQGADQGRLQEDGVARELLEEQQPGHGVVPLGPQGLEGPQVGRLPDQAGLGARQPGHLGHQGGGGLPGRVEEEDHMAGGPKPGRDHHGAQGLEPGVTGQAGRVLPFPQEGFQDVHQRPRRATTL